MPSTMLQIGSTWTPSKSGLDRYFAGLLGSLRQQEVPHDAIAFDLTASLAENPHYRSFGSGSSGIVPNALRQSCRLRPLLKGTDVAVSHCTPSMYPGLPWLGKTPLICHFHGPRFQERALQGHSRFSCALSRHIEQTVYRKTAHFIVLSRYMSEVLQNMYGVREEKISVVPGGIDLKAFTPSHSRKEARALLGIPENRFVMSAVRRLDRRMGLDHLVLAMRRIASVQKDALLLLYGEGPIRDELAGLILENSLSEHVKLQGFVSDSNLPLVYRASEVSVMPSTDLEGFGMSILESLAAGTPVMGTPVGAIPEVLSPLGGTLVFQSTAPDDIAAGLLEVMQGRIRLPEYHTCREVAESHAWPVIGKQILDVYEKVLAAT